MKPEPKFVDPSLLYTFATRKNQRWFKYYPVLNRRLGYQAGTVLNYLLDQQWYIETHPDVKRRHPHYYRSERDLAKDLGFSLKIIRESLNLLRDNELIWTECKGWPRRNNFYFNQQRIMDIIVSEPSHSSHNGGRTI
jgi:hypothetical protein